MNFEKIKNLYNSIIQATNNLKSISIFHFFITQKIKLFFHKMCNTKFKIYNKIMIF